jgi:hypothetical protein
MSWRGWTRQTDQAVFRRSERGEQAGFPRCKGQHRSRSFTCTA